MIILGLAGLAGSGKDTVADWFVKNKGFVKLSFADEMKRFVLKLFPHVTKEHLWGPSEMRGALVSTQLADGWGSITARFCDLIDAKEMGSLRSLNTWVESYHERTCATVREILQTLGTEWGRAIDPLLWVKDLYRRQVPEVMDPKWFGWKADWSAVDSAEKWGQDFNPVHGIVIPDHRFPNEVKHTQALRQLATPVDNRWLYPHVWRVARPGFEKAPVGGIQGHASEGGLVGVKFDLELDLPEGLHKVPFLLEAVYQRFLT